MVALISSKVASLSKMLTPALILEVDGIVYQQQGASGSENNNKELQDQETNNCWTSRSVLQDPTVIYFIYQVVVFLPIFHDFTRTGIIQVIRIVNDLLI